MKTLAHNTPRPERGQALAEFSLILPILLLVVFGIIDFGRVIFVLSDASTQLRDAARKAEILGLADTDEPSYANCVLLRTTALQTRFVTNETVDVYYWDMTNPDPALPIFDVTMAEDINPDTRQASQATLLSNAHYTCQGGSTLTPNPGLDIINPDGSEMDNGDLLRVHYTGRVNFLTPFLSALWPGIDLDFYAQRTVVTQLILGSTSGIDYDFDGLDDRWEFMWWGCVSKVDNTTVYLVDEEWLFAPLHTWQSWTVDGNKDWKLDTVCGTRMVTNPEGPTPAKVPIPYKIKTDAVNAVRDTDGDECNMGCEENRNSQPIPYTFSTGLNNGKDTDGDGLTDGEEANIYFTNPSGGDWTYCDWNERYGAEDGSDYQTHSDGVPDGYDSDCDGVPDGVEVGSARDPQIEPNDPNKVYPGIVDPSIPPGWPYRPSYAYRADSDDPDNYFDSVDSDGDGLFDHEEYYDETPCDEPHEPEAIPYMCRTDVLTRSPLFPRNEYYTNPTYFDEDGIPGADGIDTDGDGLSDYAEIMTCFERTFVLNRETVTKTYCTDPNFADGDGDGLLDGAEVTNVVYGGYTDPNEEDTDTDGLSDYMELLAVEDGGYGSNPLDNDSDFDGLQDDVEIGMFSDPRNPNSDDVVPPSDGADVDGDGFASTGAYPDPIADIDELLPGETLLPGGTCADMNDGYEVNSLGTDPTSKDTDSDGLSDCYELNANLDPTNPNTDGGPGPAAQELDGVDCAPHDPDRLACDEADTEGGVGDGLQDWWEMAEFGDLDEVPTGDVDLDEFGNPKPDGCDNLCEFRRGTDPLLWDTDGDGLGDNDELPDSSPTSYDTDGDGLHDGLELGYTFGGLSYRLNPRNADSDNDGLTDGEEYCGAAPGTPVNNLATCTITANATNAALADSDGDGLWDMVELYPSHPDNSAVFNANYFWKNSVTTDPLVQDSDGDGWTDYQEIQIYYNWQPNPRMADTDLDGLDDQVEGEVSFTLINDDDTDGDGLLDGEEYNGFTFNFQFCFDPSGGPKELTVYGFSSSQLDRLNPNSEDSDGDGLLDGYELNTLGTNPTLVDTDNDDINDNQEVADNTNPLCGGDIVIPEDKDTDGDGLDDDDEIAGFQTDWGLVVTNPSDEDSDGDGLLDKVELDGHAMNDVTYYTPAGTPVVLGTIPTNPTHIDYNGDGQNDGLDSDLDGINDNVELAGTNSTKIPGAMMSDVNCNGDTDTTDTALGEFTVATLIKTNPANRDTDGDGMPDWAEIDNNLNPLDGRCGPQVILTKSVTVWDTIFQKYWQTPGFGTENMTPAQAEAAAILYAAQQNYAVNNVTLEIDAGYVVNGPCGSTGNPGAGVLTTAELNAAGVSLQGFGSAGGGQCGNIVRGTISELVKLAFSTRIVIIEAPNY
jgi:hypothetical protein